MHRIAEKAANLIPFGIANRLFSITPLVPFYHLVTDEKIPHVRHLYRYKNEKQFISDIDFLGRHYQAVPLADVIEHVGGGRKLKKGSFLLTFDDGYSQTFTIVAPILQRKGIPAVFFVNTDFIDNRALSHMNKISLLIDHALRHKTAFSIMKSHWPEARDFSDSEILRSIRSIRHQESRILDEMADRLQLDFQEYLITARPFLTSEQICRMIEMGFQFGAHSLDHPFYADLSLGDQLAQTIGSLQVLKDKFPLSASVFAFPHNDYSVSKRFFETIAAHSDLTFGTSGPKADSVRTNVQRIDFEKSLEPAKDILNRALIKKSLLRLTCRSVIMRN